MRAGLPALALALLVAACGTLQEQCLRLEARELYLLDRQIAETQATLQRGYALEEVEEREWRWVICGPGRPGAPGQPPEPPERCWEEVSRFVVRPKAVNMADERRKLASLQGSRRQVELANAPGIAACKAKYPE